MYSQKKEIAFVMDKMLLGGCEHALIKLLNAIDYDNYNVTLFVEDDSGPLQSSVNKNVKTVVIPKNNPKSDLINNIKSFHCFKVIKSIYQRIKARKYISNHDLNLYYSTCALPYINDIEYDCVIAYQILITSILANSINRIHAKKRVLFVHGESPETNFKTLFDKIYDSFDRIFCVSEYAKKSFSLQFPISGQKSDVLHINVSSDSIINKSKEPSPELEAEVINIVTVGRLAPPKGQILIPLVAKRLVDNGYKIKWFCIGDGISRINIEEEIKKYNVENSVILLGAKQNPYPYIYNCDIYVQPSFSEGWGLTVQEARILNKPIVVTPTPVMNEQIINNETGIIVDDFSSESLFVGIKALIDDPKLRQKLIDNLSNENHVYSDELQKLYDFIES